MSPVPVLPEPARGRHRRPHHLHRWVLSVSVAVCAIAAVLVATDWERSGAIAFVLVSAGMSAVIVLAPWRHRHAPRALVALPSLAGVCFLASLLSAIPGWLVDAALGPLRYADVLLFAGYACLGAWKILLVRRHAGGSGLQPSLSAVATAIGSLLALWTIALSAYTNGTGLAQALVIAAYPTIDVVLVSSVVHLALTLDRFVPPLRWLLATLVLLFVLDTSNALYTLLTGTPSAALFSGQVFVTLGFAVTAAHPNLPDLWSHHEPDALRGSRLRTGLLFLTLVPVVLAVVFPVQSRTDTIVRTVLVTDLLGVIGLRLWHAVSHLTLAEQASRHRATHDHLTGLLNRAALLDALTARLRRDARNQAATAVMFLDLDKFKHINDTYGHDAGDAVLSHVATTVPTVLRADDLMARLGGDEFVIVSTVAHTSEATTIADRVLACFAEPVRLTATTHQRSTPSIGIAVHQPSVTPDDVSAEELITRADEAMYDAKRAGRGCWAVHRGSA